MEPEEAKTEHGPTDSMNNLANTPARPKVRSVFPFLTSKMKVHLPLYFAIIVSALATLTTAGKSINDLVQAFLRKLM